MLTTTAVKRVLHLRKYIHNLQIYWDVLVHEKYFFAANSAIIGNILERAVPNDRTYFLNGKLEFISQCANLIV